MTGSRTGFVAVAVFAALSGACGGKSGARGTDSSTSPDSSPTPGATATPAATPSLPEGIYVSGNGNDASAGTAHDPLRTIQHALAKAQADSKRDVFVIGGGANGIFDEVVTLPSNIHLQGSVCPPAEHDSTLTIDANACVTALIGGSPAIVASHIDDTEVADFQIAGAMPQGAVWSVDGAGCVGHGNNVRAISCEEPADADGRALPAPALAVVVSSSQHVTFTRTRVVSATAATGMAGVDGARGADATRVAANGSSAGNSPWAAGGGGSGAVNDACGANSQGGTGGLGGRWYRGQFSLSNNYNLVFTGIAGASTLGAAGGAAAPLDIYEQRGASGFDGSEGIAGTSGTNGTAATGDVDTMSLAAKAGDDGASGLPGFGGAGGGGGAPGSREMYVAQGGKWWLESYAGTSDMSSNPYYSVTHNMGETAAGGGGGGGAGGCAGFGGHGGQSGAVSVALVVRSSTVTLLQSEVASGNGGAGAVGGLGGEGGVGSAGATGGFGATTATQLAGSYDAYGTFLLANESAFSPNGTVYYSGSQGGKGGAGGVGGKGGRGGNGGGGAGGSSIGVLSIGAQVTLVSTNVTHGLPGNGAEGAAAGDAKDQRLVP